MTGCATLPAGQPDSGRDSAVQAYMEEFVSGVIIRQRPQTRSAIWHALHKIPEEVFLEITDRRRPVIFLDYYTVGIARFASSTEFIVRKEDAPMFQDGFYVIKLGDALEEGDADAIAGVVLHEIAHRYLEHLRLPKFSCEQEREANRLLKAWGVAEEYEQAKETFGAKDKADSPCFEPPEEEDADNNDKEIL